MSGEQSSSSLNSITKPISDITVSVAAVVAYLQAVFKLVDTVYPNTVSLLTIVLTSIMVISWRWGKLNQKRRKSTNEGSSKTRAKVSWFERLREPFRIIKPDPYTLQLPRRRLEGGFLAMLTMFTVGWSWANGTAVVNELTKDPSLTCSRVGSDEDLLIMVANVVESGTGPSLLISDKIYNALVNGQADGKYAVCRLGEGISLNTIAEQRAEEHGADLVIWGLTDRVTYEIHLTAPALSNPDRKLSDISSVEAASVEFQFNEPDHISYAAQFALSEILFMNGQTAQAQFNQNELLRSLGAQSLGTTNPRALADGYFLMGLFYDPGFSDSPNEEQALAAYHRAMGLDPALYAASFNRGLILMYQNKVDEAIAEFTYVIEGSETLTASALVNRASLLEDLEARLHDLDLAIQLDPAEGHFFRGIERMNQEDYRGAIEDFQKAVEADPQGYYNYHLLGQAQLYAGDTVAAKQTYVRIIPTLNNESRDQVIRELQENAENTPEIVPAVEQIVGALQEAKFP